MDRSVRGGHGFVPNLEALASISWRQVTEDLLCVPLSVGLGPFPRQALSICFSQEAISGPGLSLPSAGHAGQSTPACFFDRHLCTLLWCWLPSNSGQMPSGLHFHMTDTRAEGKEEI